jgi:hypothetical protein
MRYSIVRWAFFMVLILACAPTGAALEPEACTIWGTCTHGSFYSTLDAWDYIAVYFAGDSLVDRCGWDIKVTTGQSDYEPVRIQFYNRRTNQDENAYWQSKMVGGEEFFFADWEGWAIGSNKYAWLVTITNVGDSIKNGGKGVIVTGVQNYHCSKAQSAGAATLSGAVDDPPLDDGCGGPGPGDSEIPTLSEWAMIIFSVLLLGMMTYYVVRRRRTAQVTAV